MNEINTPRKVQILPQPTDVSCGPTCLQAVYDYYHDTVDLSDLITDVKQINGGGTLAVMLGNHALKRGYKATIYTYNLQVFDPSWFDAKTNLSEKLAQQIRFKGSRRLKTATKAYQKFLASGGKIRFKELTPAFLRKTLRKGTPILTGLSATYLYQSKREIYETNAYDDLRGEPSGHFVVLCDYDPDSKAIRIADPLNPNPIHDTVQYYSIDIQQVINAILLGIVTYDANLLIIEPNT